VFRTKLNVDCSINKHKAKLVGYSDIDWGGSLKDMKCTSGYFFSFGSRIFSWCSKKQKIIAKFTTKVDFIATTAAVNQVLLLKIFLIDLKMEQKESRKVFVDNQAAITTFHNPVFHGKTKHFNIKLFFLREVQKDEVVDLVYCKTKN